MAEVGFFTAISFGSRSQSFSQSFLEAADGYFYLGGRKAYVISGQVQQGRVEVVLADESPASLTTVFKVISYCSVVIPVIMLICKIVLRSTHSFYIIDVREKLEEGIDISPAIIDKIRSLKDKIQKRQADPEIIWYGGNSRVFSLVSVPHLIFKTPSSLPKARISIIKDHNKHQSPTQVMQQRFANMIKVYEVCMTHHLSGLVIPHARQFQLDGIPFIAEECLHIQQDVEQQKKFYQELSGLDETIKQLATLIIKTGLCDVAWRNMPIIDTASDFSDSRRIALLDLEEMEGADIGIFGQIGRSSLIGCLFSERQIDLVLDVAQYWGVSHPFSTPQQVKEKRMLEIKGTILDTSDQVS